ncbi:MAG: starch-binding protein [Reichenbachiella sp.]
MKRQITILSLLAYLCALSLTTQAQTDFREETIYFLMTTRFFDGDPNNNAPNEWCSYNEDPTINTAITDPNDVTWRGDFKGLMEKLDYIQDLGFTAIWITPIVQNAGPLDYHGYHAYDFTKVDPRLESEGATFQDLVNAVHAKGMKIVLDIVTNHSGRFGIKGQQEIKYNSDPTETWGQDSNGDPLQPNPNWEYDGITPNPDDGKIWSRANIPALPGPYNADLAQHNWPSTVSYVNTTDIEWYHHSGNGFAQGWDDTENLYNRGLAGDCPDLNTSSQTARDYLVDAYTTFINMGVDGFRWDTMKHMDKEDVLYFKDAFHAVNPDLFIFGEVAQLRHELHNVEEINPHWYTWRGAVNASENSDIAVLDFYAEATFHGVFESGESFSGVTAAARYDHLYSDPSTLLTWLDNHDFGPNNDWNRRYGGSDENLAACMNFMFTWRGIPVVYYGTEKRFMQGTYADIHDASGIEKSINETGRAYYGAEFDNAPSHIIYQHIKKLNAMRRAIPALQKGTWRWDGNAPGNAVGYVRQHGDSEVAVGLAKDGGAQFNFSGLTNGIYRDAVTGAEISVSNGAASFFVEAGSAGIFVLNGPGMIGGNGVGFFQSGENTSNPIVSVSPSSGHYSSAINVTMNSSSQNEPSTIYYTTDGSTPNTGSQVYSSGINIEANSTVKALAVDSQGNTSAVVSNSYTFGELDGFSVYLKKDNNWNNANIYHWAAQPDGSLANAAWPGPTMIDEGDNWYRYDFIGATSTNLIFSDNGGNKTVDMTRSQNGWYVDGTWFDTDQREDINLAPSVSIDPNGGTFFEGTSVTVSLSATDDKDANPSIFYTIDGTTASSGATAYTGSFDISGSISLSVIAVDSEGLSSDVVTADFIFVPEPEGLTVHFKPIDYTEPIIYFWAVTPNAQTTGWPGVSMTAEEDGWYSYSFEGTDCANFIFSNNGSSKTIDLTRCSEGWYTDGTWYDMKPNGPGPVEGLTIHFKKPANWNSVNMHYWNATPASVGSSAWPGVEMQDDGGDWYSYTLEDAECINIVFNDNGSSQTSDLTRCGDGWYDNDWSNSSARTLTQSSLSSLISFYPNPATQGSITLKVDLETAETLKVSFINLSGQIMQQTSFDQLSKGAHLMKIDTKDLANGIYIIQIKSQADVFQQRLVIDN